MIQGCYNSGGNLKVVSELPCPKGYTSLSWNQEGPKGDPGTDGVSPAVTQLNQGDANCPTGGAALVDASGSTAYVCNGAAGADGQSFSGTFTSPNGGYSISVTDAGITLEHGPHASIKLVGDTLELRAGTTAKVEAGTDFTLKGGSTGLVQSGGPLSLKGSTISLN